MKYYLSFIAFLWMAIGFSQQPIYKTAKIEKARVYYNGAELHQKVNFNLPKGQSELVISNLANQVYENSIRLKSTAGISVLSVQYSNAYIEEYDNVEHSPLTKEIRDSIQQTQSQIDRLNNEITTDQQTINLLDANLKDGKSFVKFSTVNELQKWTDYYQNKRLSLQNGLLTKRKDFDKLHKKLNDLKARLETNSGNGEQTAQGKLIVRVLAERAGNYGFEMDYVSARANWKAAYELEVEDIQKPVQLTYKAEVSQNTGLDWKDINLSLTSGGIQQNQDLPKWNNWFLRYQQNFPQMAAPMQRNEVQYDLEEVAYAKTEAMSSSTINNYTQVQENQLRQSYQIDLPYTIISNGKSHAVNLTQTELQADYEYYAMPKLNENAFLVASISDYTDLHLISGQANIIFDRMYVGKSFLSIENTDEELEINLGKDPQIAIDRKLVSDKSGTKFLSSKKEQKFEYEIRIKNNKNRVVNLKLEDQFPLSTDKSIEVDLTTTSKAKVDEEKGILSWNLDLKPGETQTIRFGYKIKSDKDKRLNGI